MTLKKLTEHNQLERRHITWLQKTLVVVQWYYKAMLLLNH